MVKTLPSNSEGAGSMHGLGTKMARAKRCSHKVVLKSVFLHVIKGWITFPCPSIPCLTSSPTSPHHLLSPRHLGLLPFLTPKHSSAQGLCTCCSHYPESLRLLHVFTQSPPQGGRPSSTQPKTPPSKSGSQPSPLHSLPEP